MSDTDVDNKDTVNSAYIPMTTDKVCIKYNDNPATLAGIKYEVKQFWTRNGHFQEFLISGAVPMRGGKLAVDSANAVLFQR